MGCLFSKNNSKLINVAIVEPRIIKEYSVDNLYSDEVLNKRRFPELLGKTKDEVLTYFHVNYPHLIIKFDEDINPYLNPEIYEFYDILIKVKNDIVYEIPEY